MTAPRGGHRSRYGTEHLRRLADGEGRTETLSEERSHRVKGEDVLYRFFPAGRESESWRLPVAAEMLLVLANLVQQMAARPDLWLRAPDAFRVCIAMSQALTRLDSAAGLLAAQVEKLGFTAADLVDDREQHDGESTASTACAALVAPASLRDRYALAARELRHLKHVGREGGGRS